MKTVQEHKNGQCTMNNVQWKKVKLGNCCAVNPKTDTTKVLDDDVVTLVRMEDVSNDGFITSFSERTYKSLQKRGLTIFQNEDVIFAKITPCMENGKGALVRNMKSKICMGSTEFHVLRACDNVSIDFIYQLTISKRFRQRAEMQMTGSAGQQRVPTAFLEDCLISIPFKNNKPDLPAQRRIAAILTSADKVIASTQKLIAKYKQIKQGLMEELLKPKEGWKIVRLEEVCEPSSEKYNPLTESDFSFCIEMENINQESGTINGKSDITKLLSLKNKFHKGEVLYGKLRPYLRKYWLADCDGACSTEIWVLKNAEDIDNQFLFYLFQSDYINRIANLSSGTKMPRADWAFMRKQELYIPYKINKPDLAEQRRIASILSGIDAKVAAEEKVLEKYEKVKKGLMERMLEEKQNH